MPDSHRVYSYSAVLMGSPILLKLFSHDEALASRVFRLIKQYEDLLTVNRAHSQVMDINHAAGQHPVTVSRPVFELIRCAKAASLFRDSAFNLAIGPLVKRWKIGFQATAFRLTMKSRRCWRLPVLKMFSLMRPAAACS
ncbi:Membrane-associated lipoprotein involved in thiamine biosynthesis [Enterobacter asburiae]|uniref:FAD:protein FMN transferase n=1 Tax=Enterobacter asburiae TaxID=61645 RepID=A0A376FN29_ENTAS|nr:Membrane-associated lipoprotein involved in thiamine biosynthesis [Enterobacter asburiae]